MLEKNDEDSSSSEDETYKEALKEAADHQFLKQSYFSAKQTDNSKVLEEEIEKKAPSIITNTTNLKSLRRNADDEERFENFGVSASFQNFVAKKLDEILEKSIKLKSKAHISINEKKDINDLGIKLLNSSVCYLTTKEEDEDIQRCIKHRKRQKVEEDSKNLENCKEVAVDPEWILSKEETRAWTSRRKGPEFTYKKLKNGTLVEKE